MTRITQSQLARQSIQGLFDSRDKYNKYAEEVSSGLKVTDPGDSQFSGTISQYKNLVTRIESHSVRIENAKSVLSFQDNAVTQLNDLMIRAKEIATQSANETVGSTSRAQAAKEIWEIRDHIVQLANSKYQDRYIYGGADDDDAPFDESSYVVPAGTGPETKRYAYDNTTTEPGNALSRTINLTDDFTMTITTSGQNLFGPALTALEQLGRSLAGYSTEVQAGPVYTGTAYTLSADTALQTRHIKDALDAIDTARKTHIMPERIGLGSKLKRIDTAEALLELTKSDAKAVLSSLQDADVDVSATNLTQAELTLNASYAVSSKILQLTILNYL
jgi:flagellar hook-associated protein 3 FlgL